MNLQFTNICKLQWIWQFHLYQKRKEKDSVIPLLLFTLVTTELTNILYYITPPPFTLVTAGLTYKPYILQWRIVVDRWLGRKAWETRSYSVPLDNSSDPGTERYKLLQNGTSYTRTKQVTTDWDKLQQTGTERNKLQQSGIIYNIANM